MKHLFKGQEYLDNISGLLERIYEGQGSKIEQAADMIAEAILGGHALFAYGNVHSAVVISDNYLRAGGLALLNQVMAPALNSPEYDPPGYWIELERLEGYGRLVFKHTLAQAGDVLIVISTSGRNAVPIEMGMAARERGLKVIVITSLQYTTSMPSRHSSGKLLFELGDVVIDNLTIPGDAILEDPRAPVRFCPTSGVVDFTLMQMLIAETIEHLVSRGYTPPIFSAKDLEEDAGFRPELREMLKANLHRIFYDL